MASVELGFKGRIEATRLMRIAIGLGAGHCYAQGQTSHAQTRLRKQSELDHPLYRPETCSTPQSARAQWPPPPPTDAVTFAESRSHRNAQGEA